VSGCCLLDGDWGDANEGSVLSPPISHITLCRFPRCRDLRYWLFNRENAGWRYGGDGAKKLRCSTHWLERRELGGAYLFSVAFMGEHAIK
jgi:hypothetical protein